MVALNKQGGGTLQNDGIAAVWHVHDGRLAGLTIHNKVALEPVKAATLELNGPFLIDLQDTGVLPASALLIRGEARVEQLKPDLAAARKPPDRLSGIAVHYALDDPTGRFHADWALILRQGSSYIRQSLTIIAGGNPVPVSGVELIDVRAKGISVTGTVKGSPLVARNFFLGFESPLSESSVVRDRGVSELHSDVPISAGQSAQYSSVVGVAPQGQMRRAFLTYLERERAHPYRTFLHYNSWFDIGYDNPYTQQEALDRIHSFGEELNRKRGVTLDSFLFDDGWDETNHLWKIRPDFKDGFEPLTKAAAEYGAAPGVWMSPWGGYNHAKLERLATAKKGRL